MKEATLHIAVSILALGGLFLIVFGFQTSDTVWQIGLAVLGIAMLASFATRWVVAPEESKKPREEV